MVAALIGTTLNQVPAANHPLFRQLFEERRLRLGSTGTAPDDVDALSARLVCAALARQQRVLVVLPDSRQHRPALLLTCALLHDWLNWRESRTTEIGDTGAQRVALYAGASVGIREQLEQITIPGLRLSLTDVFRQRDFGRQGATRTRGRQSSIPDLAGSALPQVVTLYAPINPESMVAERRPNWIAIDCDDEAQLAWLDPLLTSATKRNLPIVAWSQNPLSHIVQAFARVGYVVTWPPGPARQPMALSTTDHVAPGDGERTQVQPLVITTDQAGSVSAALHRATTELASATRKAESRLFRDAVGLHWGYLRAIETLSIPVDFFETEAPNYWGVKTFAKHREASERFRDACRQFDRSFTSDLDRATVALEQALDLCKTGSVPLWEALSELIVAEVSEVEVRVIIFSSRARKQLFLLTLLARFNITEDDLRSLQTWLMTADEFQRLQDKRDGFAVTTWEPDEPPFDLPWRPLLVGLPSPSLIPKLTSVLRQERVEILVYPHQINGLRRRVAEWNDRLGSSNHDLTRLLQALGAPVSTQAATPQPYYLRLVEARNIDIAGLKESSSPQPHRLLTLDDPTTEIALLFVHGDDDGDEPVLRGESTMQERSGSLRSASPIYQDTALEIEFAEGWRTLLPLDETVQLIIDSPTGFNLQERFVRALRPGDRVLFIQGQARQSLYDLIVSRVHHHPAIQLHLELIRRWQADAAFAYSRWQLWGERNHDELLRLIRIKGSRLTSSLTISHWLRGVTLCPQDREDLRRLAEVLDMAFVRTHYLRIHLAATRMRGLHRGLSLRLNRWLEDQVRDIDAHDEDDLIDAELGLTFSDLRDSLLILRVTATCSVPGPFLPEMLGDLEKVR